MEDSAGNGLDFLKASSYTVYELAQGSCRRPKGSGDGLGSRGPTPSVNEASRRTRVHPPVLASLSRLQERQLSKPECPLHLVEETQPTARPQD